MIVDFVGRFNFHPVAGLKIQFRLPVSRRRYGDGFNYASGISPYSANHAINATMRSRSSTKDQANKNPAAVALGKLACAKGGAFTAKENNDCEEGCCGALEEELTSSGLQSLRRAARRLRCGTRARPFRGEAVPDARRIRSIAARRPPNRTCGKRAAICP